MNEQRPLHDDWMTDEHRAAALEGWNTNPVARAAGLTSTPSTPAAVPPLSEGEVDLLLLNFETANAARSPDDPLFAATVALARKIADNRRA